MERTREPERKLTAARVIPLVAILVVAVIGFQYLRDYLTFDMLRENRQMLLDLRDGNYVVAVGFFLAVYVAIVAFSLPGATIASLTGGFLFGVFPGVLFNVLAATVGATVIFLAARTGLGEWLGRKMENAQGTLRHFNDGLRENEISFLFLIRLLPVVPFFVANLVPALVGVSVGRFVVTTFFGIMPGAMVYTWIGAGLGSVFARGGRPDLGVMFEPRILIPILALCMLALLPSLVRKMRKGGVSVWKG